MCVCVCVCRSLYSEERKLLRIQAWEQRNQEICQEQKGHPENVPLFGKPYKVMNHQTSVCVIQDLDVNGLKCLLAIQSFGFMYRP